MALATGAAISNEFALVAAFAREVGQRLAAAIAERAPGIFDSYRPELHYMRGPGPKWRAKQGLAPRKTHSSMCSLRASRTYAVLLDALNRHRGRASKR